MVENLFSISLQSAPQANEEVCTVDCAPSTLAAEKAPHFERASSAEAAAAEAPHCERASSDVGDGSLLLLVLVLVLPIALDRHPSACPGKQWRDVSSC